MLRGGCTWVGLLAVAGCFIKPNPPDDRHADARNTDATADAAADAGPAANFMFVTSVTVGFGQGLAAADGICNTLAHEAQPPLPGTYVAWLSTGTTDARDRVGSARGWVRTDGKPFGDTIDAIGSGVIYYPPRLDENGSDVGSSQPVGTGTTATGVDDEEDDCGGQTNVEAALDYGYADAATPEWTASASQECGLTPLRMYCFGVDRIVPVPPPAVTGPRVFVSPPTLPNLGTSGLDNFCMTNALANNVAGTFVAAIGSDSGSIQSKLGTPATPWVRFDGVETTSDFTTFTAPIDVDVTGAYVSGNVFTGVANGSVTGLGTDCANWTTDQETNTVIIGDTARSDEDAIDIETMTGPCNIAQALYCAEVTP